MTCKFSAAYMIITKFYSIEITTKNKACTKLVKQESLTWNFLIGLVGRKIIFC